MGGSHQLTPVFTRETIHSRVVALANQISTDYQNQQLVLIGVLKGAFVFLSDLARSLSIGAQIDFVSLSSYGSQTVSCGDVTMDKDIKLDIRGKHVLVVEDIVDTGITLSYLMALLKSRQPASVDVCALIDKHERRQCDVQVRYAGFTTQDGFLVGYGLDYNEQYRELPQICHLELESNCC